MATLYYDAINDGETQLANTLDIGETTSFVVNDGSQLPVGGAGTSGFIIKLEDTLGNAEYIECSSRSGNTVNIANRGFEDTFARTWIAGSYLKNVWTKATKDEITDKILVATDTAVGVTPTSIEDLETDINAIEADVGDLTYTEQNLVTNGEPLTDSVDALDVGIASHLADNTTAHGIDDYYKKNVLRRIYEATSGTGVMTAAASAIYGSTADNKLYLVTITDLTTPANNWVGISQFSNGVSHVVTKIAGATLTVATNNLGTLSPSGGSGNYKITVLGLT